MDKIRVRGGRPLEGTVRISGAKNASLPDMCATLLTDEPVVLHNVPEVRDICTIEAPYELVKTMRASVLVLGPLLAREGRARVSLPGGCAIGARPINLHLQALSKLGIELDVQHGYVEARARRLRGTNITFDTVTVTGTENVIMAACRAKGETVIDNAACEPEIVDLCALLCAMGGEIDGAGTSRIRVRGVESLHGATHDVMPDRIETGTYLAACAVAGGEIEICSCRPNQLRVVIDKFRETGVRIEEGPDNLRVRSPRVIRAANVTTSPFPGFPTDMQAQYMAFMTQATGTCTITETIFENRFMHVAELRRMGADVRVDGRTALVVGPTALSGAQLMATDLRASACLVLAGLAAGGETIVDRVYHLDRGYYRIDEKLRGLGADIERLK
jgi:UDP-N-acetylglucosamine 1-carboxyvinyltransferase